MPFTPYNPDASTSQPSSQSQSLASSAVSSSSPPPSSPSVSSPTPAKTTSPTSGFHPYNPSGDTPSGEQPSSPTPPPSNQGPQSKGGVMSFLGQFGKAALNVSMAPMRAITELAKPIAETAIQLPQTAIASAARLPGDIKSYATGKPVEDTGAQQFADKVMQPVDVPVLGEVKPLSASPQDKNAQTPWENVKQAAGIWLTGGAPGTEALLGKALETKAGQALLEHTGNWWEWAKNLPEEMLGKAGAEEVAGAAKGLDETASMSQNMSGATPETPNISSPQSTQGSILQSAPDATPIDVKVKTSATKSGIDPKFINLVETGSAQDRAAMKSMVTAAEDSSKSYLGKQPSDVAGETILQRVDHLHDVTDESGKALGNIVKTMPKDPVSVKPALDNFMGKLNDMGIKVTRDGLDFSQSSLSGTTAGETQRMLTKTYKDLISDGSASMSPQRMHTLRQALFSDLDLGKQGAVLDSRADTLLQGVRQDLGDQLGSLSPEYAENSKKYAVAKDALTSFNNLMGRKFAGVSGETLAHRTGEVSTRIAGNASADVLRVLSKLEEAAKGTGYVAKDNMMRQLFFANGLQDIFDITKPASFRGGISKGAEKALDVFDTGYKAAKLDAVGIGKKVFGKYAAATPEKAQVALKTILGM